MVYNIIYYAKENRCYPLKEEKIQIESTINTNACYSLCAITTEVKKHFGHGLSNLNLGGPI